MNATEEFFIFLCVIIIVSVVIWYFKIYKKPTEIVKSRLETLLSVDFKDSQHILNPVNGTVETYVLEYAIPQNLGKYVDLQIEWKNGLGFTNAGVTGFVLKRKIQVIKGSDNSYKYINVSKDQTKLTKDESNLVPGEEYNITDNTNCIFIIKGGFIQDKDDVVGANIIEVFAIVPGKEIKVGSTTIFIKQKEHLDPVLTITKVTRVRYVPILGGEKESLGENATYTIESGNKKCKVEFNTDYQGVANIDVGSKSHTIELFKYNETEVVIRDSDDKYLICEDTGSKKILRFVYYDYLNNKIRESNITDFGFMTFTYEFEKDDTTTVEVASVTPASFAGVTPASFAGCHTITKRSECTQEPRCKWKSLFWTGTCFPNCSHSYYTGYWHKGNCLLDGSGLRAYTKRNTHPLCFVASDVKFEPDLECPVNWCSVHYAGEWEDRGCVGWDGLRKYTRTGHKNCRESNVKQVYDNKYCPIPVDCKTSPTPDRDVPTYITHCFGDLGNRAIGGIVTKPKLNTVLLTAYKKEPEILAANGGKPCVDAYEKYWDTKFTESEYDPVCTKVSCPPCSGLKKTLPQVGKIDNALSFSLNLASQIKKSANIPFFKETEYAKLSKHPDILEAYKGYLATGKYTLPSPQPSSPSLVTPGVVIEAVSSSGWATFPTYLNAFSPASNESAKTVTKSGGFNWKGLIKGIR